MSSNADFEIVLVVLTRSMQSCMYSPFSFEPLQSPLLQSIFGGCSNEFTRQLEVYPDDVSAVDHEKRTMLHAAAFVGMSCTRVVLCPWHILQTVQTPNFAGNADFLERLIAAAEDGDGDANVNAKDSKWLTPLHRACRQSNEVSSPLRCTDLELALHVSMKAWMLDFACACT